MALCVFPAFAITKKDEIAGLTGMPPVLKPAIMNTPESEIRGKKKLLNFGAVAVAIAALAGGVLIGYYIWRIKGTTADQPATYVLHFGDPSVGDRVKVDQDAFIREITSPAPRWCSNLQIAGVPFVCPSPSPVSPTIHLSQRFEIREFNQDFGGAPNTMHVTQKVGLDTLEQVNRVLATIQKQ
jgi:hypothetical protein